MKKEILLALLIVFALTIVGCSLKPNEVDDENLNNSGDSQSEQIPSGDEIDSTTYETSNKYSDVETNPVVTLNIKDMGIIKIELYPQIAPTSVENFIELVQNGFYDGLTFHRTIPGFMIQGGDPEGNGTGGPDYSIKGEFSSNGVDNKLSHTRGIVSMARSEANDSAGSQFFIVTTDSTYLDGNYAAFGRVIEGMDVADKIVNLDVIRRDIDESVDYVTNPEEYIKQALECDKPVNPPVISSATVDTFGVTYDAPAKIVAE